MMATLGVISMQDITSAALATFLAASFASQAMAYSLSPAATRFTVTGTVFAGSHGRQEQCTITMVGVTGKNGSATAKIKSVTFVGSTPCADATNLPWKLTATGPRTVAIANLAYTGHTGQCGPSPEVFTIDTQGVWSIRATDLRGGCSLIASGLVSKPPITIVP
jgi:hypothetical protein